MKAEWGSQKQQEQRLAEKLEGAPRPETARRAELRRLEPVRRSEP
jgi:hypothetical protein